MGKDLATTDAAFGFAPWGNVLEANIYAIVTNNAVALGPGMLMEVVGTAITTKHYGTIQAAISEETGAAGSILGAVLACFDHNNAPISYIPASTTGDGVVAGYALIADHPQQLYVAQEDGVTSSLVVADIGLNVDAIGTTVNTTTGISLMEIDSNTMNTTNTLALKLVGVHPDDTISAAGAAGNWCRFICMINSAHKAANVVGV
jgi:hypothetical protein